MMEISIQEQQFILSPHRALYWKERDTLILSDLHLGKTQHFRKHGIAVPIHAAQNNFTRLSRLFEIFKPAHVILLGDLFHSEMNETWARWVKFVQSHHYCQFSLVLGNHDILDVDLYIETGILVFGPELHQGPFCFSHDNRVELQKEKYNIYGHIHPAVKLFSKSGDHMKLSCFYFAENYAIMPAFGVFTGNKIVKPFPSDRIFAIVEDEVLDMGHQMKIC